MRKKISKRLMHLLCISCFIQPSHLIAEDVTDEDIYNIMEIVELCVMKPLAGQQPDEVCSLAYQLRKARESEKSFPNTVMFYGPPGTGKTEVAEAIAHNSGAHF